MPIFVVNDSVTHEVRSQSTKSVPGKMDEEKQYRTRCYRNVIVWMFSAMTLDEKEQIERKLSPAFGTEGH